MVKLPLTSAIAPAPVHKLGHFGMCVTDFAEAFEFYTTRFNFVPSDVSFPLLALDPYHCASAHRV